MTGTVDLGLGRGYNGDEISLMAYTALREAAASWLQSPMVLELPHLEAHWARVLEEARCAEAVMRQIVGT